MSSVCLFGGSFNPVHIGHLLLSQYVIDEIKEIKKVVFVPAYIPPHKNIEENVSVLDRINMLKIAVKDNPSFDISFVEIERKGVSYTIDTVNYFLNKYEKIYLLIGEDSLYDFHTWKNYKEIIEKTYIIVFKRYCGELKKEKIKIPIEKFMIMNNPIIEISSSDIRKRIREKKSIKYMVTKEVEKYICEKKLYI